MGNKPSPLLEIREFTTINAIQNDYFTPCQKLSLTLHCYVPINTH